MSRKNRPQPRTTPAKPVAQRTDDSFANFQARLGWGADNQTSASQYTLTYQSRNRVWLEAAYRGSWIVRAAVDAIPEDMTRAGIEMSGLDPADTTRLEREMARLANWDQLCDTGKWAQLYGGCLGVMLIDGQDLATPLRIQTVGRDQFKGLLVLDRWMVAPPVGELVTELGPDLGKPKYYEVIAATAGLPTGRIHYSRVIRMDGEALPFYQRIAENGWGLSILEPMWDRLIAFDSATVGIGQLVYKAHLRVLQIEKLREILAVGGPAEAALRKQIEFTRFAQTNEGITLLDASDVFNTHQYSFSGLDSVLIQFGHQLCGAIGVPYTRMFGQAPAGLNATGEGDMKQYHEKIKQRQERKLRNPLGRLLAVQARSRLGTALPEDFDFDVVTPTVVVQRAAPGKVAPEESVREFLAGSEVFLPEDVVDVPVTTQVTKETLADLLDEKLSRRAVKDIQSGIKDPDRFDKWLELLQERVDYEDRIVLPYGEGMNIVRRSSDGELVIRTDAGADLCRWDQNWKLHVPMFVRDTDELYEEIYPKLGHPEGTWQELREYYCPVSGRLLETEAVPPGYPVMHEYLPDIEGFYKGCLRREMPS